MSFRENKKYKIEHYNDLRQTLGEFNQLVFVVLYYYFQTDDRRILLLTHNLANE